MSSVVTDALARSWCRVLGVRTVDEDSNFFDQGGSSLAALQASEEVTETLGLIDSLADELITLTISASTYREVAEFLAEHHPPENQATE
jgi:hypothetical protein